jgi:drug/metabolite transporter (DMT)-like permease
MQAQQSTAKAAAWMAGWLTLMLVIAVAGREATRELAVFQVMEMRSIIGLFLLWPLVRGSGGLAALRTQRLREHAARNTVHYAAQYAWFAALTMIPLAQVVAIEFTMPIWIILLAAAFLGERITAWKVLAVALGLCGVGLIVRPSAAGLSPGQLVALAAAVGFAVSVTMVKSLTRTDSPVAIIFWMLVVQSLLGLLPALWVWRWPSAAAWGWVLLVAFCGTFSHYCMARAMRHAEATVVMPMDYLRVPLTALAGWLIYAERMDLLTVLGAALILGGNLLNTRRAATR